LLSGEHEIASASAVGHCGLRRLWYYESHVSHKEVSNMKLTKNLGLLLLGIWLIATGIVQLASVSSPVIVIILAVLAIAAGVLILLGR
jgi:hypothetical protein